MVTALTNIITRGLFYTAARLRLSLNIVSTGCTVLSQRPCIIIILKYMKHNFNNANTIHWCLNGILTLCISPFKLTKKRTRDLWNKRRESQTQTKLDQPS